MSNEPDDAQIITFDNLSGKWGGFNKEAGTSAKSKYARRCPRMCI